MTSADVAAAAGVSRATVSYVLNGVHDRISPETQARVFAAAERLGYVPNAMASALRAGRTEIVLLALPSWPLGQAVAEWVTAGVAELERMGYTPLVHFRHGDDRERLIRACDRVRPIAVIGPGDDLPPERVEALRANGTRAVMAISPTPLEHVVTLLVDQALVGEVALDHLAERGHRHVVAVIPGEPQYAELGADRVRGAKASAAEHGVKLVTVTAVCSPVEIGSALAPILSRSGRPTALYAFNDEYAFAAIDALESAGLTVPGDIAVIGCDNSAPARRARLTTIMLADIARWPSIAGRLQGLVDGDEDRSPLFHRPAIVEGTTT